MAAVAEAAATAPSVSGVVARSCSSACYSCVRAVLLQCLCFVWSCGVEQAGRQDKPGRRAVSGRSQWSVSDIAHAQHAAAPVPAASPPGAHEQQHTKQTNTQKNRTKQNKKKNKAAVSDQNNRRRCQVDVHGWWPTRKRKEAPCRWHSKPVYMRKHSQ